MAELIAITFDTPEEAQAARLEFAEMSREHLVELTDSVVAYKDSKGKVRLDQTVSLPMAGAVHGGFLGVLVGVLLSIPFGGPLLPAVTGVFGVGFGALSGKLSDYGIDDDMMKLLSRGVEEGKAALFVLVRKVTIDKVLQHLEKFRGTVLRTSLSSELEHELQRALDRASAA